MATTNVEPMRAQRTGRRVGMLPRGRYGEHPWLPYLMVLPHFFFFVIFVCYAAVFSFWISLHEFDFLIPHKPFVGLRQYQAIFNPSKLLHDYFWNSLWHTFIFVFWSAPAAILASLLLALLLNAKVRGRNAFRSIYLTPWLLSVAAAALLWRLIFADPDQGILNLMLKAVGIPQVNFFSEMPWPWLTITADVLWQGLGFNIIVVLAGLQGIPSILYEAASIDGAGWWAAFRNVTLPGLRAVLLFLVITQLLGSFNIFAQAQLMTQGGPGDETTPMMMRIYEIGFQDYHVGSAAAMSFVFGLILAVFSLISFRLLRTDRS